MIGGIVTNIAANVVGAYSMTTPKSPGGTTWSVTYSTGQEIAGSSLAINASGTWRIMSGMSNIRSRYNTGDGYDYSDSIVYGLVLRIA
jgi:hypothetical protein